MMELIGHLEDHYLRVQRYGMGVGTQTAALHAGGGA